MTRKRETGLCKGRGKRDMEMGHDRKRRQKKSDAKGQERGTGNWDREEQH